MMRHTQPARNYRDRLFRMIFKEKKNFLELYNALNGTSYDRTEDLTVTTMENAVYLGMKNDLSFLLYDHLPLYEHQSTDNPNLPLRDLLYIAGIYSGLTRNANLYGKKLVRIPTPQFVVFYNGEDPMPERKKLYLSDAYEVPTDSPKLELEVLVLNINPGNNPKLMEQCRTLAEYGIYTNKVRTYRRTMALEDAVELAIRQCIEEGILTELLSRHRAEVKQVSIFEYDEEKHIRQEREDAWEDGHSAGKAEGVRETQAELMRKLLGRGEDPGEVAKLMGVPEEEVLRLMEAL